MSHRVLLVVVALCVLAREVGAAPPLDDHVVVVRLALEPPGRGLFESLRIQLVGRAKVSSGPALVGDSPADRREEATALVRASDATLVVYGEPVEHGQRLVVVGPATPPGEPVQVRSFLVPDGEPAETQRTMALKIVSVLDLRVAASFDQPEVPGVPAVRAPRARTAAAPPRPARGPVVAVLVRAGTSAGDRGVDGAGELRLWWRRLGRFAPLVAGGVGSGDRWAGPTGEVTTREWSLGLGVHALVAGPIGASATLGLQGLAAEGTTPSGARGDAHELRGEARLAVDAAWWLGGVRAAVEVGLDVRPGARDFAVNQVRLAGPAGLHPYLGVGVGFFLW
jgi:hypothetical protein